MAATLVRDEQLDLSSVNQKPEFLGDARFSSTQPKLEWEETDEPIVAVDTVGAGPGEIVFYITASEAVLPLPVNFAPVDASIVGIVDSIYSE